jgi:hypothetical protein
MERARRRDELVVVFGHHTLATMDNPRADERAGACATADEPGCDRDPRRSTPLHRGAVGARTVGDLLLRRRVVAYVAGHTHSNRVDVVRRGGRALWEINTASHIDWPQQSRLIEVADNRDGTLSIFATMVDHAGPASYDGRLAGPIALAALARELAGNDWQERDVNRRGRRRDRNVELLVQAPAFVG